MTLDYAGILEDRLDKLGLPDAAHNWLMDVWHAWQVLDDAADGTSGNRALAEDVTMALFVRMPLNGFWQANAGALVPMLALQITKWKAANAAEAEGRADARSYMWRAGYYDLVAAVCLLCGKDHDALAALSIYGETFEEYRGEFPCQPQQ